jgi:hypothetical protein
VLGQSKRKRRSAPPRLPRLPFFHVFPVYSIRAASGPRGSGHGLKRSPTGKDTSGAMAYILDTKVKSSGSVVVRRFPS